MKSPFLLLLSLLVCSVAQSAVCPTGQLKDEATLVQVERAWLRIAEQHDVAALACILADEFEEADFDGSLINRSAMLANAAKPGGGHYDLSDLRVRVYGDFAYVRGIGVRIEGDVRIPANRFTDIFVYREGRWQCIAGHESHFPAKH